MQDPGHIPAGFYLVQQRHAGRVYVGQAGLGGWMVLKGSTFFLIGTDRHLERTMSSFSGLKRKS